MAVLIYVVDDERVIATTLAAILKKSDYDVKSYFNASDALDDAETTPPDILISDVAMPRLNGIELAKRFRAKHPACRILLFSGHAFTSDLIEKSRSEGHDFQLLNKPVHPNDLLAAITSAQP